MQSSTARTASKKMGVPGLFSFFEEGFRRYPRSASLNLALFALNLLTYLAPVVGGQNVLAF